MAVSIPTNGVSSNVRSNLQNNVLFLAHLNTDSKNRLYYGDNLDVLRSLTKDTSVCGKVKLVYIDPPYSTGGIFQTRDLKDAYTDTLTKWFFILK
jgi:adenine-specific DNA-methyltransferase